MKMKQAGIVEIYELKRRGCEAEDWSKIIVSDTFDPCRVKNVRFIGKVTLGAIKELSNAIIEDCRLSDGCVVRNVQGYLKGLDIGRDVTIIDVGSIEMEPEAACGFGTEVSVLDETGGRPVYLYPGLSAQTAALSSLMPRWNAEILKPLLEEKWEKKPFSADIAEGAVITGCHDIKNVLIGREVKVEGAFRLHNGTIINNAASGKGLAYVGLGVDAENFIVEDGYVGGGTLLRNVYVGQGASLDKGFTAHDSLFFANSAMENGEACAVLAAPYTVSMHKSTLLIGMRTSFMNAGSATNFSNHRYKLGPVHWGVLDRGVKTASGAYIMWGGRIGAFSLVMGSHKYHPDTSMFPYSYLFGDDAGHTTAVPGVMLRSCGLQRDAHKWPIRDKRLKRKMPLHDNVCYDVLNPATVQTMLRAIPLLRELAHAEPDSEGFVHHGAVKLKPGAAIKGMRLYSLAITSYLYSRSHEEGYAEADPENAPEEWIDIAGQIVPRTVVQKVLDPDNEELPTAILSRAFAEYKTLELAWAKKLAQGEWSDYMKTAPQAVVELESLIEQDREAYKKSLAEELETASF